VFKERRFLSGLGVGIAAGAILLQLMTMGQQSAVLPDLDASEQPMYTEQEVEQMVEKAKAEAKTEAKSNSSATEGEQSGVKTKMLEEPDSPKAPSQPKVPVQPNAENPAEQPEQPTAPVAGATAEDVEQTNTSDKQVIIRIEPGASLTSAAKLLAENGLIASQSKFISKMKNDKKLVRAGYFVFKGESTLDEIIKTLTSQPITASEVNRIKSNS
jgi:hypothetical protein